MLDGIGLLLNWVPVITLLHSGFGDRYENSKSLTFWFAAYFKKYQE